MKAPILILVAVLPFSGCVSSNVIPRGALVREAKVEVSTPWGTAKLEAAEIDTRALAEPSQSTK